MFNYTQSYNYSFIKAQEQKDVWMLKMERTESTGESSNTLEIIENEHSKFKRLIEMGFTLSDTFEALKVC